MGITVNLRSNLFGPRRITFVGVLVIIKAIFEIFLFTRLKHVVMKTSFLPRESPRWSAHGSFQNGLRVGAAVSQKFLLIANWYCVEPRAGISIHNEAHLVKFKLFKANASWVLTKFKYNRRWPYLHLTIHIVQDLCYNPLIFFFRDLLI